MNIQTLTDSQNELLNQVVYLSNHFKDKHDLQCFSQSIQQFTRKLGYTRRTIQTGIRKLKEAGLISIAEGAGFMGSHLFYVHFDKLDQLLQESITDIEAPEKVKNVFWQFIQNAVNTTTKGYKNDFEIDGVTEPELAADFLSWSVNEYEGEFADSEDRIALDLLNSIVNDSYEVSL